MDRIYKYNPDATYKSDQGRYLQLITAKDFYCIPNKIRIEC